MTFTKLMLAMAFLLCGTLMAQEAKVMQLMSKELTDLPGREGVMITVDYPPGSSDPIHRHNAHAFVYVLEGSIVMQVRGGKQENGENKKQSSDCSRQRAAIPSSTTRMCAGLESASPA
jgi:hypothetical protein